MGWPTSAGTPGSMIRGRHGQRVGGVFAETPNYRGLGQEVLGREAFRWHHGPMFFRGRLDGSARVVVVGQEGAQDESLSHRSFTGGTGARMQHLLRHLGLDRSYLFLNSFVYPIFGQYTDEPAVSGPGPALPDRHPPPPDSGQGDRRRGCTAGDRGRSGGQGVDRDLDRRPWRQRQPRPARPGEPGVAARPGAGGGGGASRRGRWRIDQAIKADFQRACDLIRGWVDADAGWLPTDPGVDPQPRGSVPVSVGGRSPTATSRLGPARGWAAGGPPATAPTPNGPSSCSQLPAATTAPATGCAMAPPPVAALTATATTRAICPMSRRGPTPTAFDPGPPANLAQLLLGIEPGFDVAGLRRSRGHRASIVRGGGDLPGPVPRPQPDRPGRPGLQRRPVHRPGLVRGGRPTPGAVPARRRPDPPLSDPADPAGRHPGPHPIPPQPPGRPAPGPGAAPSAAADVWAPTTPDASLLLALGPGAQRLAPDIVPAGMEVLQLAAANSSGAAASWQAALDQLATRTYPKDIPTRRSSSARAAGSCPGPTCPMGPCGGSAPPGTAPSAPPTWT